MIQKQCYPNLINYNTFIKSYTNIKNLSMIEACYKEMIHYHIDPNVITYNTLIKAYDNMNQFQKVIEIHRYIIQKQIQPRCDHLLYFN